MIRPIDSHTTAIPKALCTPLYSYPKQISCSTLTSCCISSGGVCARISSVFWSLWAQIRNFFGRWCACCNKKPVPIAPPVVAPPLAPAVVTTPEERLPALADLPFSEEQARAATQLLDDYATRGAFSLGESIVGANWNSLRGVHPLKLFAFMNSDAGRMKHLHRILNSFFNEGQFLMHLDQLFADEQAEIEPYIPDFVRETGVLEENVRSYTQQMNWRGLLKHLSEYYDTSHPMA
ncbi:MAG: hypothetical protein JSS61_04140 [Verrucomicrobia bacterium]|nr:hypothetical protein [Verrucomicrobiota bacterium]